MQSPSLPFQMPRLVGGVIHSNGMSLDITKAATWKSSSTKVAKVSNAKADRGLATGVKKGKATITATLSKKSGTATLTVSE